MISEFKIRKVNERLGISGVGISFNNEDFFGLKVGDKVLVIGDGRENGCFRTDFFSYPVTYVGSIICQFDKPEKMYAFDIDFKDGDEDVYCIYGSTGSEIFTESTYSEKQGNSYIRFYTPVFSKKR